jgi:hypothetical protein
MRQLVSAEEDAPSRASEAEPTSSLRGWLRAAGAPLLEPPISDGMPSLEELVVLGLRLAHEDSAVARALPVLLWRVRHQVDYATLAHLAARMRVKQTLGFYLDLAGDLGGDRALHTHARALRDGRIKRVRDFFVHAQSERMKRLAEANTPRRAREWKFRMNLRMESFAELFAKFEGSHAALQS